MKKLLLGVVALGFLATACKKDDDNNSPSAMLVGTWKVSKFVVYSGKDNSILASETVSGCNAQSTMEFKSDKTFLQKSYEAGTNGSCMLDDTDTGTYSYNEGTKELSTTYSGSTTADVMKVENLTHNQLSVSSGGFDLDNDGFDDKSISYLYK